jgi:ribosomal protein L3 glutamine methyltransferase
MAEQLDTPRALIEWGAEHFERAGLVYAHGTDNALDEAAYLVLRSLRIDYDQPDSVLDRVISPAESRRVRELLEQRLSSRKPAAYLLQEAWFAGLPFYVDERVLVPRSPIAELIESRFAPWIQPDQVHRVLDMCTGSGCIGIACAHVFPDAQVDVSDISTDALAVATENIRRHQLTERVSAIESDLFDALQGRSYDIIVVNPPYVPSEEQQTLAPEFEHEPSVGLFAGREGLDIVVEILCHAGNYLNPHGILVVEVGNTQDLLAQRFPGVPFMWFDFEYGGTGVFMLDARQLRQYRQDFQQAAEQLSQRTEQK